MARLFRHLVLSFDPPSLRDPKAVLPPTTHHLRANLFDRSSAEALPNWFAERYARPLIYVTLGSEAARNPGIFPGVYLRRLAGLRDGDGTVVLTIGHERDPAELGVQPDHIHVERYIPQSLLLAQCDLVLTHGGHNTVLAALQFGLPMVVVPLFADQFDNGARCAEIGVAQTVAGSDMTPARVRDAVRAVLGDARYREHARRVQAEIHALPPIEHGVRLLEQLVSERRLALRNE